MMKDNIVQLRPRQSGGHEGANSLVHVRLKSLEEEFRREGKRQTERFERLSRIVERLVTDLKASKGEKSGALKRAFAELAPIKGRFSAREGVPPNDIYRTPAAWLRVLKGLAVELDRDPRQTVLAVLEESLVDTQSGSMLGPEAWLSEFSGLMGAMRDAIVARSDLASLVGFAALNGLFFEGGEPVVSEWPYEPDFVPGGLYSPLILGVTPHVLGLNYEPIAVLELDPSDSYQHAQLFDLWNPIGEFEQGLVASARGAGLYEGVRTGLAFAVRSDTGEPDIALLEWHLSGVILTDAGTEGSRFIPAEFVDGALPTHPKHAGYEGEPDRLRPANWVPNSVRLHFRGTAGFELLARASVIEPWAWTDPQEVETVWSPDKQDFTECPLLSPRHTVAAVVEGNLLYADQEGTPKQRLDRLLTQAVADLAERISAWRAAGELHRKQRLQSLLSDWRKVLASDPKTGLED